MTTLTEALKNEYTKRALHTTGVRRPSLTQRETPHYRMPRLQTAGGYLRLKRYDGPEIPRHEYEDLTYTTYSTDDATSFAPITSCTGALELKGFEAYGKPDLDGVWTENAKKCPTIVSWVESIGARFGRVQLLRMRPNTIRECRWGLHLDNNNAANDPAQNGWVVRLWLELTDDDSSALVCRREQFDRRTEVKVPLPATSRRLSIPSSCTTAVITTARARATRSSPAARADQRSSAGSSPSSPEGARAALAARSCRLTGAPPWRALPRGSPNRGAADRIWHFWSTNPGRLV